MISRNFSPFSMSGGAGLAVCLALASCVLYAPAHADEIDDILKAEKMAYDDSEAGATGSSKATRRSASRRPAAKSSLAARQLGQELSLAREEIAMLKRKLAEQEVRHRLELLHSHYNMGCVYKAARQYQRAEAEFLQALEISPEDPGVHFNLGILYDDDLGDEEKARFHYNKYVELAPNDSDVPRVMEWLATMDN